ncbi:MAG: carbohydrate binding family 9 domain-containing protein [Acidobacteriota bacterium]|nr:carbohydrate binding family 9 domain-containing protein [Acidobacteriota bacterium]
MIRSLRRACGLTLAILLGAGLTAPVRARAAARPGGAAPRAAGTIEAVPVDPGIDALALDGRGPGTIWSGSPAVSDFEQREPSEGAAATFPTSVRVAYDARAIYVDVEATDPDPSKIVGLLTRRDVSSPSDWIRVLIDSYDDRRSAFEFAVNAAGVKEDSYWYNDSNQDVGWDAVWDVTVAREPHGWRARFRIPLSQLRFAGTETAFGFAVVRQIARLNETDTWPLLAKSAQGYVSSFGQLTGLRLDEGHKTLELTPYAVTQLDTQPPAPGNPFVSHTSMGKAFGADLKYALTPGLTLTATVNPDFGQVEADPAVVNLSGVETYFDERRPFFTEGSGIFHFDTDCSDGQCTGLFYSRRIGRAPQISVDAPANGYVDEPTQTTIIGAAKLTGRVGNFSVGALNAVTAEEDARIADGAQRSSALAEPLTSYSLVRARREFANQSTVGFMVTSTNRRLRGLTGLLPDQAYTGGVDWDWRVGGGRYSVAGYWAGSLLRGDAAAIDAVQTDNVHGFERPGAGYLGYDPSRTSLGGQSAQVSFSKIGGETIRFNTNVEMKSPGFDINDLGYMQRADLISMGNWLQWRHDRPTRHLRSYRFNFNQWSSWNHGGDRLYTGGNVNGNVTFRNNWSAGAGVNLNAGGFDDRLTRGGPGGRTPGNIGSWLWVNTDDRRMVSLGYNQFFFNDHHGSHDFNVGPTVTVRPSSSLSVVLGMFWDHSVNDYQWVEQVDTHDVLGHLDQHTTSFTARVNYTLTPNLSIQLYAQPFVSGGAYSGYKALVDGRAARYQDEFAPFDFEATSAFPADNPDFNVKSFRSTNVLRWEYHPGSTLFIVWQQNRERDDTVADFQLGQNLRQLFGQPANNVFLIKVAQWLNF